MLSFADLRRMARERVADAKVLRAAGRYDGAVYIVGYAIEYQLKARIATALLGRRGFPENDIEFSALASPKTHRLPDLLKLAGREARTRLPTNQVVWQYFLSKWRPEVRYTRVGSATRADADQLIASVEKLLRVL